MFSVTWRERVRYRFDNWMSRGPGAIMALLGIATLVFVGVVATVVVLLHAFPDDAETGSFWDVAWGNLMRTLDPGTMGADAGWAFRALMLLVTVGGLIIVASLIGIVSGAFDDKMVELRRGRSRVIENGHTLILGWNSQLFTIISELCAANASRARSTIVVLADHDKIDMERQIRSKVHTTGSTQVICRRGSPLERQDLHLGSPETARSIVVLPSDEDEHPDALVIKTALALTHQLPPGSEPSIVAELTDPLNLDAARLASRGHARWLLAGELISRMTVQTCLQGGLSAVCTELLDFAGDEIYFTEQPQLVGVTYLEAQCAFTRSTVMGIARGEDVRLNPPAETALEKGDQLVLIAADDSTIECAAPRSADATVISELIEVPEQPERILVLGSNSNLQRMVDDLAKYLAPGSSVHVVADSTHPAPLAPEELTVEVTRADTTSRHVLEQLGVENYDHVLVLAYHDRYEIQVADSKTLVTLLHLRDIADRADLDVNIVSEMLDDRNRELAEVARPDDFIVSSRLVSLMLAQVSENSALITVFEQLFSGDGSEIYVVPSELYIREGAEADFYTVAAAAARRQETALGYRIAEDAYSSARNYGVQLNPPKGERRTFQPGDSIIVLAENGQGTRRAPRTRVTTAADRSGSAPSRHRPERAAAR